MGRGLTLYTIYQVARITVPTYVEGLAGRIERNKIDRRLREFGDRLVRKARIRLDLRGADLVPLDRAYVYMSNHQSHMDIPVLCHTMPSPTVRMVAKTELFRIPIYGRAMRAGGTIEVDRASRDKAIASLERAGRQISEGVSVWIAPEGTRSRDGTLGPLKRGGFHLAVGTGTPIVPIAISGTRNILPPKTTKMLFDVPVRVTYGTPIDVAGRDVESLMDEVARFFRDHV
jgi:1-acyl-sn-glycerol-3-phosphate acyltransferase